MNDSVATSTVVVENEVHADLSVNGEHSIFVSNSTTTTTSGTRLVVRAYQHMFNPFRIVQISFGIPLGTSAGTYRLGDPSNGIVAQLLPPNTAPLDSYNAIQGSITFVNAPTLEYVHGTFHFKARKFNEEETAIAEVTRGTLAIGSK
ncbi:hypothetical protein BK648_21765 [Pseudomonas poae]|uniref:Uncharacterized protein n=1 Tax=Pseudomonas poae TaxID=200451 RepID=A0A423EQ58_9PSED|nr:DUF6252 family protein [Pseudomonas poae]ROM33441.1 hypothetical protein BK648_21765 [Pseudomonas poae]